MDYVVARGSIKMPTKLPEGAKRTAVPRPKFIMQDELIPEGALGEDEIESLLAEGRIAPLREGTKAAKAAAARRQQKGKWSMDPASLKSKTMEELMTLILGIDENFNVAQIKTDGDAVRQLSKDFDPAFTEPVSRAYDRNTPGLTPEGVKEGEMGTLSPKARRALAEAKAKAGQ